MEGTRRQGVLEYSEVERLSKLLAVCMKKEYQGHVIIECIIEGRRSYSETVHFELYAGAHTRPVKAGGIVSHCLVKMVS